MGILITPVGGCSFTAPKGWTLDNKAGISQGALVVAYSKGSSYSNSPVLVYSRSIPRDASTRSAADAANGVVKHFHSNGHSRYRSKLLTSIHSKGRGKGEIYTFEGDNWGNFEAACYFTEPKTMNSIVFHAKSKAEYDAKWNDYLQMCRSYIPVFVSN
jgi:hypothetical protein